MKITLGSRIASRAGRILVLAAAALTANAASAQADDPQAAADSVEVQVNTATLCHPGSDLVESLESLEDVANVDIGRFDGKRFQLIVRIDRQTAFAHGVDFGELLDVLGDLSGDGSHVDDSRANLIEVTFDQGPCGPDYSLQDDLDSLPIVSDQGALIPIYEIAEVSLRQSYRSSLREDGADRAVKSGWAALHLTPTADADVARMRTDIARYFDRIFGASAKNVYQFPGAG